MGKLDLTSATILVTFVNALLAVFVMQVVTTEAGFHGWHRLKLLCQRTTLFLLSLALGYDCYNAATTGVDPRVSDLWVHVAMTGVLACWAYRKQASFQKASTFTIFHNSERASKSSKVNNLVVD